MINYLKRINEIILLVLLTFYDRVHLPKFLILPILWNKRDWLDYPFSKRLRLSLESLGPVFIKLGQFMSTRPDILPVDCIEELSKLQDKVPPEPLADVLSSCHYLKPHVNYFDPNPIGSGSIAQVHKAVLKDGKKVAVKVIRKGINRIIERDMNILKALVLFISMFSSFFREFRIASLVMEFEDSTLRELDLGMEGANAELFREFSKKEKSLVVPKVMWEFSSKDVLVMEFIDGVKLLDIGKLEPERAKMLSKEFVRIVIRMVFELGVFHGDLHPGNIFLVDGDKFALVDFGIVGTLSPDTLSNLFVFSLGVMQRNPDLILNAEKSQGVLTRNIDEYKIKREMLIFLNKYYNQPLSRLNVERLFYEELSEARKFRIILPEEYLLLLKTIVQTEAIARMLYPDFRLPPMLKPYLLRRMPSFILGETRRQLMNLSFSYSRLLRRIPNMVDVKKTETGIDTTFAGCFLVGLAITSVMSIKVAIVYFGVSYILYKRLRK